MCSLHLMLWKKSRKVNYKDVLSTFKVMEKTRADKHTLKSQISLCVFTLTHKTTTEVSL